MHAIRLHAFGVPDNLIHEYLADPVPGPGEVRVAVEAAGVHTIETKIRRGETVGPHLPPALPLVPGGEVAGTVDAVGDGVEPTWIGRRVAAHLDGHGGYAELAVARVENLYPIPDDLSADVAVAMVGTGATTLGLLHATQPTVDDAVLVLSAAGGIGTLLVQSLHREGIFVVGAAGGATKTAQVHDNGADIAVDYSDPDWPERLVSAPRVSVVMDGVGGRIGRQALELLAPAGRIILYGWASGSPTEIATTDLISRQLTATWALGPRMVPPGGWDALRSTSLARAAGGEFRPLITRFPLSEAAAAHAAVEGRTARGKVILTV
ncbi:zinc-binding dehydrogenase [Rhodococcus artemisiae]|uniref:Zinc-binding dehydrogenase n=1 Tax=Rhodococcus artemisiae TaxID=714159 RepID=A0ABU7LIV1_9NOCA|nr:zinc-binding dehydrogenase [Rhodococcus artemisiae]MEE2061488.1 zinc-binding dehydrogenase [Rhodococcus artemisiae]